MASKFQGAEAIITRSKGNVVKLRQVKEYRHPVLDVKLRTQRTKKEVKLLQKATTLVKVPQVMDTAADRITMQEIKGNKLADCLDKLPSKTAVAKQIGAGLGKLHDSGIIHGDLTTSNLIKARGGVYFIDFGLGYESQNVEDKAVDLHVLKEALEAKHPEIAKEFFKAILDSYKSSKGSKAVLKRLEVVELRGRYKKQY